MNRHILATVALLALPLGLAACQGTTPATVATDSSAAVAAAGAITAIATDLQGVDVSTLSAANVAALATGIGQLQAIATSLTVATQPADVASAATTVSNTLADISAFLPSVTALLPLLTLVEAPHSALLHYVADVQPARPALSAAQVAQLKAHIAALAAAKAKAQAQAVRPTT